MRWGTLQAPFTSVGLWRDRLIKNDPAVNWVLVAEVDGEAAGTAGLHPTGGPRRAHARALGMSVFDAWQGRGVGQALMLRLLEEAEARKLVRLELEVFAPNTRAVALYEKHGFQREGLRRQYAIADGGFVDAWVMARTWSR